MDPLKSERLEVAIARAVESGDAKALLAEANAVLSSVDPRKGHGVVRAVGAALAPKRGRADQLLRALANHVDDRRGAFLSADWGPRFAVATYGERLARGIDTRASDEALQALAEDRDLGAAIVDALRVGLEARGEAVVDDLAGWTDGYLQAHLALATIADKDRLARFGDGVAPALVARLDEAFSLADRVNRGADRSEGVRTLRRGMPAQIVLFAARFPTEVFAWFEAKLLAKRPETREVVELTIEALRRANLSKAATGRLRASLDASAPPPRDPSRIVKGMRRRGRRSG